MRQVSGLTAETVLDILEVVRELEDAGQYGITTVALLDAIDAVNERRRDVHAPLPAIGGNPSLNHPAWRGLVNKTAAGAATPTA